MRRFMAVCLGLLALAAPVTAGLALREPAPGVVRPRAERSGVIGKPEDGSEALLHAAARGTPFRIAHQAPVVRFGSLPAPSAVLPSISRPHPVLTGLLWGRSPLVLLEGIPGHEGAVVLSRGDTAGGIRVGRIARDQVTLTGMDTSWTLTVRQPWP